MSSVAQTIGQRIRTYRLKAGMTQEALAEKANLHHTYIGQVERGEKNLTLTSLEKITYALDISFTELFDCLDTRSPEESIPSKCFEMINSLDEMEQAHVYNILKELEFLIK
jgi:transcriptional regulator with XRE-family HTH domain